MSESTADTMLQWTDATGTTWRISRQYSQERQQWEATIVTKRGQTWFERERMVLDDTEVLNDE